MPRQGGLTTAFFEVWEYTCLTDSKEEERLSIGLLSVTVLKFLVEVLLLSAAGHLCKDKSGWFRILSAAAVSAVYCGACLCVRVAFLRAPVYRIGILALTVWLAFGFGIQLLYKSSVYLLLNAAIGGFSFSLDLLALLAGAICICIVCMFTSVENEVGVCVPVELCYGNKKLALTALRDTGNTLKDPLTGRSVLIIGADSAEKLTGLSVQQLKDPAGTLCAKVIPGLRLVPYKTIGDGGGMLLALMLKNVKIGSWTGNSMVAFAPEKLGNGYQALTGGKI